MAIKDRRTRLLRDLDEFRNNAYLDKLSLDRPGGSVPAAWFLGPKAENADFLREMIGLALENAIETRKEYGKDDPEIPSEQFCETFTGSWQFGFVSALRAAGLHTVIYYSSTLVSEVVRVPHKPSGATICLIPAPSTYRRVYRRMVHPHHTMGYWRSLEELFGDVGSRRHLYEVARQVTPYLATSLRRLRAELRRDGCRAIVCQDYEDPQFDEAVAVGRMARLPVYAIFQGGVNDWNRIGRTVRPRTMKLAAGFIIGPQAEIDRVTTTYGVSPRKIHRISNAVADDFFVARTSARPATLSACTRGPSSWPGTAACRCATRDWTYCSPPGRRRGKPATTRRPA